MGPRNREDTEGRAPPFLRRAEGRPNLAVSVGVRDLGGCWVPAFAGRGIGRRSCAWMGARFFVAGPPQNDMWGKGEEGRGKRGTACARAREGWGLFVAEGFGGVDASCLSGGQVGCNHGKYVGNAYDDAYLQPRHGELKARYLVLEARHQVEG